MSILVSVGPHSSDDKYTCPHTRTVDALLDHEKMVQLRGTPASGKSVLSKLLRDYYIERGEEVVLINGWDCNTTEKNTQSPYKYMATLESNSRVSVDPYPITQRDIIFLIDEAQQSYHDKGFWLGIIRSKADD